MTDPVIWDREGALARLNNKAELLQKIMTMFFEHAPDSVYNLQQAIQQDDREQIKAHSHTLKGQSATVGANRLSSLCFDIEQHHATFSHSELEERLNTIHQAFQEFETTINENE